jgi:serine/threonine protein kinase
MSDSSEPKRCPKCGSPIPGDAPQGLCPKCVLLQASLPTGEAKGRPAPSREEVAAAFPQLEILELIGQGGMGFVFKARQPKLERLVALKILPQALAADPAFAERFTREARLLARLNHPNIVAIHDFGQAGNFFYLLMEFVDGVNLRQAMRAGRFTPAQALAVVPKICEALQFAHNEGILHRDIKPENILIDTKGRVKIADFGIAKLLGDAQPGGTLTGSGAALGTPHYMAPEQLEKPGTVDHRADIYSLGVVFYEMLTGELPLGRFQPPSQKVEMDVRLDEVVLHALEKEPSRRYQQASQVKTAVETIAGGPPQPAPVAPAPKPDRFWRRMAVTMAWMCLVLIALVIFFARKSFLADQRANVPSHSEEALLLRSLLAAQQKAAANSPKAPVPAAGVEKEAAQLVIDTSKKSYGGGRSDLRAFWPFTCLVPAAHLAQVVFVVWTNGVATIKPDLSGYIKVGEKPVVLENILFSSNTNTTGAGGTNLARWLAVYTDYKHEAMGLISNQPSCRKLETAPRSVLHSGHQLAIRLAEFIQPADSDREKWSGVEIRLILQPLSSPAVQADPNEAVGTNYVGGFGLAGASEDSVLKLIKELPMEPQPVEKSP